MCNAYRLRQPPHVFVDEFSQLRLPVVWAEDRVANIEPRDDIRIRDNAPVVGRSDRGIEISVLQWAWLERGRPVFNFRSDGRSFARADRRLVPADGFYEFTTPSDPKQKRKDKWMFSLAGEPWFWIAAIVKNGCFTLLTTEPGPDIAPYHDRQVAVLPRGRAMDWLELARPEAELLRPLPAGSLEVSKVG